MEIVGSSTWVGLRLSQSRLFGESFYFTWPTFPLLSPKRKMLIKCSSVFPVDVYLRRKILAPHARAQETTEQRRQASCNSWTNTAKLSEQRFQNNFSFLKVIDLEIRCVF